MITPETLSEIPLFAALDEAELAVIASSAADVNLVAEQWLIHEEETPAFFVLLSGELEVRKTVQGNDQPLAHYHPGDFFGEVPLLLGSQSVAGIRAVTDSRVMRLEEADFHNLIVLSDKLAGSIMKKMMARVASLQHLSAKTPVEQILVVGHPSDLDCYDLRQFLSGNHHPFLWLDPDDPVAQPRIPADIQKGPYPVIVLADGTHLQAPDKCTLAERIGLQTAPKKKDYDVVIIGAGPSGLAAAVYGASEGLDTLIIECSAPGGQAGTSSRIENYLGFPTGISGSELASKALEQAQRFGTEIVVARSAVKVCPHGRKHEVQTDDDKTITASAVIIATGVTWRSLGIPGAQELTGCGIYYGAARTEAMGVTGKDVYLVGGGNSAGQAALFFADYASQVTLLIRASEIEAGMSQYLIEQIKMRSKIAIELDSEVIAVHGEGTLEAISVKNSKSNKVSKYETGALFVFIGADAETDWLPEAIARDERGYILTGLDAMEAGKGSDRHQPSLLETSVPGLFAVGDVRHGSIKRVASAVGEGSMAIAFIHQYFAKCETLAEPPPSVSE